jgi:CHAT domain-containing protein/tetratricopeptide (TPR) repeat protein
MPIHCRVTQAGKLARTMVLAALVILLPPSALPLHSRPLIAAPSAPAGSRLPVLPAASAKSVQQLLKKAQALKVKGDIVNAEAAARKALASAQTLRKDRDKITAGAQSVLGSILFDGGQFGEAEQLLRQSLFYFENKYGPDSDWTISPRGSLAALMLRLGRRAEAAGMFDLALKAAEKEYGRNSIYAAEMLNNATSAKAGLVPLEEIVEGFQRVLDITKRTGRSGGDLAAGAANNLALAYAQLGQNDKAFAAYKQAYDLNAAFFGPDHPAPMVNLMNAGVLYRDTGQTDTAARMLGIVLDFHERTYGPDSMETARSRNNMGWVELARNQPAAALPYFRDAAAGYQKLRSRQSKGIRGQGIGINEREAGRTVLGFLTALASAPAASNEESYARLDEGFRAAQRLSATAAAVALGRAGARFSAGDGDLGALLREGQDLALQWQNLNAALLQAAAAPAKSRSRAAEKDAAARMAALGTRLDEIDGIIQAQFPGYANLADPKPLSILETQKLLRPDEALVQIASFGGGNGDGTFVWIVTADDVRTARSLTSLDTISGFVRKLRCGLDIGAWLTEEGAADCAARTGGKEVSGLPRFSAKDSNDLFTGLFYGLEPLLQGKSLIVIAPDPLASLPFQVLVTKPPAKDYPETAEEWRAVSWLGRDNPVSMIPSVSALAGLRKDSSISSAPELYVGFGDPLLTGNLRCPPADIPAACPGEGHEAAGPQLAARSAPVSAFGAVFKNGAIDVEAVRSLCPLPETAMELQCVAKSLGARPDSVHIGEGATRAAIREADLGRYRIIHFATHGLVAGDLESQDGALSEPALVLTPPAAATPEDDGLLKASDIVGLKLNADWVILSACNTASGQTYGGEALSGLASAFLYSGAKALLASHWPVRSDAAVKLTTFAVGELSREPKIGRAEAMRRSMVNMLDHGGPFDAHPMAWAPFSVIGEAGGG